MAALIGSNITVSVEKTLGSPITVTAVTLATEGVATAAAHGLAEGDIVRFSVSAGMVELDGQAVRVKNAGSDQFTLEGLDTTAYSAWSSGTATEVTAFSTMSNAQTVSMPNPTPAKIDITTLIDKAKQYAYGLPDAPDGSIAGLFNPTLEAETLIKAATKANSALVFKLAFPSGAPVRTCIFNANVSGGSGFELPANAAATTTTSFTPVKDVMYYST